MATNLNIAPYYDDFDEAKNFHQVLFRPGYSVQARELTQLQSILKNQIEKFGNHIFQQGSIVIPGNSRAELGVPYIKLEATYGSEAINYSYWEGKTIIGATSGVTALVKKAIPASGSDPITFYLSYTTGGIISGTSTKKVIFDLGEDIYLASEPTILATIMTPTDSVGAGSMAHINQGVYYVNGTFVTVLSQSIVISKYDIVPSCSVLLQISESVVTSEDDATLLDPAQGSYNFAAPGADRYKITLTLTSQALSVPITDDFIEIMRYRNGVLEEHARTPRYNELEKSIARRTYDESGDYVVSGLTSKIREEKKESTNGGLDPNGSLSNFAVTVYPGKAYIRGFEVEKIAATNLIAAKARTSDHVKLKTFNSRPSFGRYIYVSSILGGFDISKRELIDLYNDNDASNVSATKIGTARVLAIDYHIGDPASNNAIYKLWITDLTFESTAFNIESAGGIRFLSGSAAVVQILVAPLSSGTHNVGNIINYDGSVRTALIRYWDASNSELYVIKTDHTKDAPRVGDLIVNATTAASSVVNSKKIYEGTAPNTTIFNLPVTYTKTLRNASNVFDIEYTVQKQLTINTNSSGDGSVTIASGSMQSPEAGTFVSFSASGVVSSNLFSLNVAGNTLSLVGGPVSTAVKIYVTVDKEGISPRTKTLTTFIDTVVFSSGQTVGVLTKSDVYRINSIIDDTGNVTGNYTLNTGQTDHAYYLSSIILKAGSPAPVGNVIITYEYFAHTSGDFFTYDSYALNSGYEDFTLLYKSSTSGRIYDLKNCIDCRPTVNSSNNFDVGAIVTDLLVNEERVSSSIQYYVPRYDLLVLNKSGEVSIVTGIPSETPAIPQVPTDSIALETYFVSAYTYSINNIRKTRVSVDRMTMKDLKGLSNRVSRLEEFSVLNSKESEIVNFEIVDAETGLNRFKTGYVVETFSRPLTIAKVTDQYFAATFDEIRLKSAVEYMDCPATRESTSSHYVLAGSYIMLPYTEETFIEQPYSSRVTNLNPFLVIKWDGVLEVVPSSDSWIETIDLPEIFESVTETVVRTVWVPPPPPPAPPAPAPAPIIPAPAPAPIIPAPAPAPIIPAPAPSFAAPVRPVPVIVPPVSDSFGWEGPGADSGPVASTGTTGFAGDFSFSPGGLEGTSGGAAPGEAGAMSVDAANAGLAAAEASAVGADGGGGGDCFTAETLITMADGSHKQISEVRVGEFVYNHDLTRVNQVKFIERISGTHWKHLYSPSTEFKPFATNNHPLIINGKMLALDAKEVQSLYPWLPVSGNIENAIVTNTTNDIVYNLWIDGDSTYRVYDYGTTSIIGDGGIVRRLWERNQITEDRVTSLVRVFSSKSKYVSFGSYVVNKVLSNNSLLDYPMSKILATDTGCRAIMPILSAIGRLSMLFRSK